MKTATQAISDISRIIQDASYTPEIILGFLNSAIFQVASVLTPPSLYVHDAELEFFAGEAESPLPDNFFYPKLFSASGLDGVNIPVIYRMADVEKNKRMIFIFGRTARIFPTPSKDEIFLISYMRTPSTHLSVESTENLLDFELPQPFADRSIISHCCYEIYNEIEDGIDQEKVIATGHLLRYKEDVAAIQAIIGNINRQGFPETVGGGF